MPAYRVALCEDEAAERGQIAGLCRDIFAALGVRAELVPFPSADALLASEAGGTAFDLYLLDIQMAGTTGLELARQLYRRGVRDKIIFLTGSAEHAIPGYDVEPLHYLLKPVDRARLEQALRRALEKRGMGAVLFQWGGKTVPLPARSIRYLESRNHGVVAHLEDGERFFAMPLTQAEKLVPAGMFRRCHISYLVNLSYVRHASHAGVVLTDGQRLPMSRTFYSEFQKAVVHRLNI